MDYALILSGVFMLFMCGMTDVNENFASKVLFRALPIVAAMPPIISGLDGLGII